jgi:16S rRNA (guanine966-N2)-methyltransferase
MRITGGKHRSRALKAPRGNATRPTSDRVREALFAILGARVDWTGARVLDLYAGTGALALEAMSRGAAHATLVEKGREPLEAIRANVSALGLQREVRVVASLVERAAQALERGGYDVVFADPPYAEVTSGEALRALADVVRAGALAEGATVVLEHAPSRGGREEPGRGGKGDEEAGPPIAGLGWRETRRYGDTCLSFYGQEPYPTE